jgi:hypothetical protein
VVLTDSDLVFKLKSLPADLRGGLLRILGDAEKSGAEELLERLRQPASDKSELPAE